MIYFTSDTHYGHKNVIRFCNRPFESVEHMEIEMISRWNSRVTQQDTVYILGDFVMDKKDKLKSILNRLNGTIRLVRGNHDKIIKGAAVNLFDWVKDYYELKSPCGTKIVLSHYPFEVWNRSHHGSWHLHGHSHGTLDFKDIKRLDVGVDEHDFYPISIDEVAEIMKNRGFDAPDGHGRRINEREDSKNH